MKLTIVSALVLCCTLLVMPIVSANEKLVHIGVLNHRGYNITKQIWQPTADYLSETILSYRFDIIPLDFDEIDSAVNNSDIDFLLVNSGIYVNMEVRYRISRIVTLNNKIDGIPLNVFGGVIFTRKNRDDIDSIASIKHKRFMAVDKTSLGGFQMAWQLMKEAGIDPFSDFLSMSFAGNHDEVVMAVKNGLVDAGTVRTGILEILAAKGDIRLDEFKIISPIDNDGFPYLHSTPLYPEWPFSKLRYTSNELAQKVALSLLKMKNTHVIGVDHHYVGWTIPLSYQPVHNLFKELHLTPYEEYGRFTLLDAIKRYWKGIAALLFFTLIMTLMSTWIVRLNRQLKKSKKSLEYQHDLVLNSVCDGIYGVDVQGNCIFMNRSMRENTGWEIKDFREGNQHILLHHSHEDGSVHKLEECPVYLTFMDKQPRYIDDDVFWKKDGTCFPVEYSSTPIIDYKGDAVGSVVVYRDISDRKLADEEKRRHQTEIAHMARLNTMGEMTSGIAHELNQPLTAIATTSFACIQMLETGSVAKDKLVDILETIGRQAEHSGEIIKQLRQFVRKEQPERSMTNINDLINEVLLFVKSESLKSNIKIIREMDESLPKVLVQPIQIEQVLLNLLKNSIESLQTSQTANKHLIIKTELAGENALVVTVEDNGPGINKALKEDVFDPFITNKTDGLGLGLSISQGIIEAHHGKLYLHTSYVSDIYGEGQTVFRFTLPVLNEISVINNKVSLKNLVR